MTSALVEGAALGLATGTLCLTTCTPIYLPYLISEQRKLGSNLLAVLEISAGRFFSYLAFGAVAGFLGANIGAVDRDRFTIVAYLLLSIYLIFTAVRTRRQDHSCHVPKWLGFTRSGFLLGVFTGINFCPSFLIALSNAIHLAGAMQGMMLFLGFFAGTSVFLLPLAFAGMLARMRHLKAIARAAAVLVAVWFLGKGAVLAWQQFHPTGDAFAKPIGVAWAQPDEAYFAALADTLHSVTGARVKLLPPGKAPTDGDRLWFVDTALPQDAFAGMDVVPVQAGYPLESISQTLRLGVANCPEDETPTALCSTCPEFLRETDMTKLSFVNDDGRLVDVFRPGQKVAVAALPQHTAYFGALADSLHASLGNNVSLLSPADSTAARLVLLDADLYAADSTRWQAHDLILVQHGYPLPELLRHARLYTFRTSGPLRWEYTRGVTP